MLELRNRFLQEDGNKRESELFEMSNCLTAINCCID